MKRFAVAVVALLCLVGACGDDDDTDAGAGDDVAATSTSTVVRTLDCPQVAFTPASEDAASNVKATGVSCAEAEAFLRVVGPRTSSGGPQSLQAEGYRCVITESVEDPLPRASYSCENDQRRITFDRT